MTPLELVLLGLGTLLATSLITLAPAWLGRAGSSGIPVARGLLLAVRTRAAASDETWGCGYSAPRTRMQYTASSFGELLVDRLLPAWLRPRTRGDPPRGLFPYAAAWAARHEDPLTRAAYEPLLMRWGDRFSRPRWLQQGSLHVYLVHIAAVAVLGLLWSALRSWWAA